MTEHPRAAAQRKVDFHEAEAARWRAWLADYDSLVGVEPERTAPRPEAFRAARSSRGEMARTAATVTTILEMVGNPIKTADLLPMLSENGIEVGGQDPAATLSARLSRSPGLIHTRGVGWSIAPENNNTTESPSKDGSVVLSAPLADPDGPGIGGGT